MYGVKDIREKTTQELRLADAFVAGMFSSTGTGSKTGTGEDAENRFLHRRPALPREIYP